MFEFLQGNKRSPCFIVFLCPGHRCHHLTFKHYSIFAASTWVCFLKIGVLHGSLFLVQRSWPRSRNQMLLAFATCQHVFRSRGVTRPHTAAATTLRFSHYVEYSATLAVLAFFLEQSDKNTHETSGLLWSASTCKLSWFSPFRWLSIQRDHSENIGSDLQDSPAHLELFLPKLHRTNRFHRTRGKVMSNSEYRAFISCCETASLRRSPQTSRCSLVSKHTVASSASACTSIPALGPTSRCNV